MRWLVKGSAATLRCCRVVLEQRARGAERSQCELSKDGEQRLLLLASLVGGWWVAGGLCRRRRADECLGGAQLAAGGFDSLEYEAHYVTGALTPKPQH